MTLVFEYKWRIYCMASYTNIISNVYGQCMFIILISKFNNNFLARYLYRSNWKSKAL